MSELTLKCGPDYCSKFEIVDENGNNVVHGLPVHAVSYHLLPDSESVLLMTVRGVKVDASINSEKLIRDKTDDHITTDVQELRGALSGNPEHEARLERLYQTLLDFKSAYRVTQDHAFFKRKQVDGLQKQLRSIQRKIDTQIDANYNAQEAVDQLVEKFQFTTIHSSCELTPEFVACGLDMRPEIQRTDDDSKVTCKACLGILRAAKEAAGGEQG